MDAKYTKKDMQLLAAVTAYVEQYISKQVITLAMAGDRSGFKNIPYFHTCFQQEYGMTPMEYLNNVTTKTIAQ